VRRFMEANMANYYFGLNRGGSKTDVAVGTSSTGKDIELFVNGTNVTDRQSVLIALEIIETALVEKPWTPL
jgi:hypothetical protein